LCLLTFSNHVVGYNEYTTTAIPDDTTIPTTTFPTPPAPVTKEFQLKVGVPVVTIFNGSTPLALTIQVK